MKLLLLLFSIVTFTVSTVKAQEYVNFGAKGGINFSTMSRTVFPDSKIRTGLHLGLLAEIYVANKISIQPEVLYSNQGMRANPNDDVAGSTIEGFKFDYIQVPVLAKLYLTTALSLEAGPSFDFLINEKIGAIEYDSGSGFEWGGAFGISYKIGNGLFGSARYLHGFTDAYKKEYGRNSKNRGLQLGMGFIF